MRLNMNNKRYFRRIPVHRTREPEWGTWFLLLVIVGVLIYLFVRTW